MKERRELVGLWRGGAAAALITLVRVQGSSYRRPGARMLIDQLGAAAGTISGGCLEAEMLRKAPWRVRRGAGVERISTQFDDTTEMPFGLGCGGVLDLLVEPMETPEAQALFVALERSLCGKESRVCTWLPERGSPLRRAVVAADGAVVFASSELSPEDVSAAAAAEDGDSTVRGFAIFAETLSAPQRLVVVGAGHDAKPLVSLAVLLGWDAVVLDGRAQLARPERFPGALRVQVPVGALAPAEFRREDAVVVMTHSYEQDREAIAAALRVEPRYLGLLGARHRSAVLLHEVSEITGLPLTECCARVHAPIGLDLGGDGPEAIALAIMAQAQACCMGKLPGSSGMSAEDVQRLRPEGDAMYSRATTCALGAA